jgi:lipopolysaccharide biosynthesis glycosyltransferase
LLQHSEPEKAQVEGAPCLAGLSIPNGGLQVINPSKAIYNTILAALSDEKTMCYDFADQSLLGDVFHGRWVPLPYIYNALKTLRWPNVHDTIWRDDQVKNIHYILSPKPWDKPEGLFEEETVRWWWDINDERVNAEKEVGIHDGL